MLFRSPQSGEWVYLQPLRADSATHTHKFSKPVECAGIRLKFPKGQVGNLRLAEIVLHGEELGPWTPPSKTSSGPEL